MAVISLNLVGWFSLKRETKVSCGMQCVSLDSHIPLQVVRHNVRVIFEFPFLHAQLLEKLESPDLVSNATKLKVLLKRSTFSSPVYQGNA